MNFVALKEQSWWKRTLLWFLPVRSHTPENGHYSYGKYWRDTFYQIGPTMDWGD